ncbi:hypothetical protein Mal52_16040 [Symmachiella dynata]|uniref:Uncharacterized protein n=1 Tax=Symmachiella dynata TaxID=2527995 RepID=A0A517ZKV8_9PLAN|nr:hypothetical protein [Symmachiella dynata]QDU43132.1 hypothetical protein Mal52_16040 [Symmachiella dynata]
MQRSLLIVSLCLLAGCGSATSASQSKFGSTGDLTANELALALGARWWNVQIPPGHEKDFLAVTFVDETGPIGNSGGSSGWNPDGEVVKFILFDTNKDRIRYAIIGRNGTGRGEMPNELMKAKGPDSEFFTGTPKVNDPAQLGDILFKAGADGVTVIPNDIAPGEIGITLQFEKRTTDPGDKTTDEGK